MCSIASTSRRSIATGVCRASSDWMPSSICEVARGRRRRRRRSPRRRARRRRCSSAFSAPRSDAQDERALLLQARLELVELLLEGDSTLLIRTAR